jgi:hypothetical protein
MDSWARDELGGVNTYDAVFAKLTREQVLALDRRKLLGLGVVSLRASSWSAKLTRGSTAGYDARQQAGFCPREAQGSVDLSLQKRSVMQTSSASDHSHATQHMQSLTFPAVCVRGGGARGRDTQARSTC